MNPTRTLPPFGRLNSENYRVHASNIARIIAAAPCIAEADLRIGYYLKVTGVNYLEPGPAVRDRHQAQGRIEDVQVFPAALDAADVAAVFAGSTPAPRKMLPGYDF